MSDPGFTTLAPQSVTRRTVHGVFALGVRQVFVQGTRILGGIFLARLLTPGQFGIYAIVLYVQTFLMAFGDAGLAASLVRQHEEPETTDYRAVFTIQQMFVFVVTLLMWFASPFMASRYHLGPQDAWLFRLIAISFLTTSFMVVPLIRMERHLAFNKVALIDSAQAIVFNVLAVYFAWRGLGAYAFVWALLLRSLVGTVIANWISPWRIGWHWDWPLIRAHIVLWPSLSRNPSDFPAERQYRAHFHRAFSRNCRCGIYHLGKHDCSLSGTDPDGPSASLHACICPTATPTCSTQVPVGECHLG